MSSVGVLGLVACLGETERLAPEGTAQAPIPTVAALNAGTPECGEVSEDVAPEAVFALPDGWASIAADGLNGTTGGSAGRVVLARTLDELSQFGEAEEPLVIQVCGVLGTGTSRVEIGSNKTLVGVGIKPTILASIQIDRAQNVVIRDVFIEGPKPANDGDEPDAVSIRRSHHVWVDHVDISDGADGNLDITNESNYVTVSWSRFWYRDPARAHRFSSLIGSGDDQTQDTGLLKVTMHHNWWADNVIERMPRARYGDIHIFNNYYSSVGNNYCIRSGVNARLLVEGNFFHNVSDPMVLDGSGQVVERDNMFQYAQGARAVRGEGFEPPYAYQLDPEVDILTLVPAGAGPPG